MAFKISRQVNIPQQQLLINLKWCQHMPNEGMECFWNVTGHIEIWPLKKKKKGFLPACGYVSTIVWMYHIETNEMHGEKAKW